jgi:hypothetical protein
MNEFITILENEAEEEPLPYLPSVFVALTFADWGGAVEHEIIGESTEWFDAEVSNMGIEGLLEGSFKDMDYNASFDWMHKEGILPGDSFIVEIYCPVYSQDYWGEHDCEYQPVKIIQERKGETDQTRRNAIMLKAMHDTLSYINKEKRKEVREKTQVWKKNGIAGNKSKQNHRRLRSNALPHKPVFKLEQKAANALLRKRNQNCRRS